MQWEKIGLIYQSNNLLHWAKTHTQCPVVDPISDINGNFDIYFSSRDEKNISRIGVFKYNFEDLKVVAEFTEPVFDIGKIGSFDDCGVMPTSVIHENDVCYLFYIGWTKRLNTPYQNSIGLAKKEKNGKFKRVFEGPVISLGKQEPYFTGTANILKTADQFLAYYLSCTGWISSKEIVEPMYNIKIAKSANLFDWTLDGSVAIDFLNDKEGGIASASIFKTDKYHFMWYCYRGKLNYRLDINNSYRIGMSISKDGIKWKRLDSVNKLELGKSNEWDSQMQCYPNVIKSGVNLYMLYNGNSFGKTGVGIARIPTYIVEDFSYE